MTSKTFIQLMFILLLTGFTLIFYTSGKRAVPSSQETTIGKEKQNDNQTSGEIILWQSIFRHLINTAE